MFKPKAIYYEKEIENYELGKQLLEKYKEIPKIEIENHNNIEEMRKKQNKEFIKNVYSSGSKEYFLKFAYKQTNLLIINFIEKEYKDKKIKEENKKFIANFYKYGFVGVMEEWIETGMKEEPQKIVSKLNDIIEGDMEKAIEKLSEE